MCAKVNIDMTDPTQYEKEFAILEPGEYTFTITNRPKLEKCDPPSTNSKCKLQLSTELEDGTAAMVFDNLIDSPSSNWKWYQFFRALGFGDAEIKEGIDLDELMQMTLRAKVKQELYKGKPQAKIARYLYEGSAAE